jgi:sporulation protein YlmC with PRC-barrel domain
MLYKAKKLNGYKLNATDGEIGKAKDFYFDDRYFTVRYLVADTGPWLGDRQVLISPYALSDINHELQHINVKLTKAQIKDSPSLNSDKPVSKQFEESYYDYYDWPYYWGGHNMWGGYPYMVLDSKDWNNNYHDGETWDPHLRSTKAVSGRHVSASDGDIGHVADFIIDDENWAIRYLVVSTSNWWLGHQVLISPRWSDNKNWDDPQISIDLTMEQIKESPPYVDSSSLDEAYERSLHQHYNRMGYWVDEQAARIQHNKRFPEARKIVGADAFGISNNQDLF